MVLVFKTNIIDYQILDVKNILVELPEITQINFDLEDCDNILRIEANANIAKQVEKELTLQGHYCEELV